jgi:hypothetical protein
MKTYVHVRVFFIMEIDGVLCELGAEAYGTTEDLNISPLTRQLYITEYLTTWEISTGTTLPPVYEESRTGGRRKRTIPRKKRKKVTTNRKQNSNTDTNRVHARTVTPCGYFPPLSVYLHCDVVTFGTFHFFLNSSTITITITITIPPHKINNDPTLNKSILIFTCMIWICYMVLFRSYSGQIHDKFISFREQLRIRGNTVGKVSYRKY